MDLNRCRNPSCKAYIGYSARQASIPEFADLWSNLVGILWLMLSNIGFENSQSGCDSGCIRNTLVCH